MTYVHSQNQQPSLRDFLGRTTVKHLVSQFLNKLSLSVKILTDELQERVTSLILLDHISLDYQSEPLQTKDCGLQLRPAQGHVLHTTFLWKEKVWFNDTFFLKKDLAVAKET
jgi:hypothetical protein